MERRRSARICALKEVTAEEEPKVVAEKKGKKKEPPPASRGKRISPAKSRKSNGNVPPCINLSEDSDSDDAIPIPKKRSNKVEAQETRKADSDDVLPIPKKRGRIVKKTKEIPVKQPERDDDIPIPKKKNQNAEQKKAVRAMQSESDDNMSIPKKMAKKEEDMSMETDAKECSSPKSSRSSMETFTPSSENDDKKPESTSEPVGRPSSRNHPRRSCVVASYYKTASNADIELTETESDMSTGESSPDEAEEEFVKRAAGKKQKKTMRKRKLEESVEETSSEEDDEEDAELSDEELEELKNASKKPRGGGGGARRGGGGRRRPGSSNGPVTSRRNSGAKTPVNKVIKPWEKNTGGRVVCGDIIVPPRKLRRGEEKMLVFRILANQLALERSQEIDQAEGYRLLDKIKAEYHEDREGYIRRILMTGGRDPDVELATNEDETEENKEKHEDLTSSSEDEWMEMEPVEAQDAKKRLEVTVENKEASGYDWWALYLRQEVNKEIRKKYENTHKAHLLCFIAHLQYNVKVLLHEKTIPMLLVTQLPNKLQQLEGKYISKEAARSIACWYMVTFHLANLTPQEDTEDYPYKETARYAFLAGRQRYEFDIERAALLFAVFVGLGATARMVLNCRPIPRRWEELKLIKKPPKVKKEVEVTVEQMKKMRGKRKKEARELKIQEMDYWVEYWDTKEKRWICIDPATATVDKPEMIEEKTHKPIHYIFAVDDKRGIRDVSARYASDFCHPEFRRRRTDEPWLKNTLNQLILKPNEERAKLEDVHFRTEMTNRPLPQTIREFKNHPLYVLERDLLKFQALYPKPEDQKPLGEIRGEKIYPRDTVHTLLGEKKWEKLARSIREGEQPYKVVKGLTDPRIPKEERVETWLNLYGYWQTETFRPPHVVDGVIPKNEYGNVYMYQAIMCPIGAVHLRLPGLPQIARRLGKECVPAVVGWDFNHCSNFPIIDGACVLAKDETLFVEEWRKAEAEREERERKKREERVLKNWKKFIQGVLRIHRVKTKFGHGEEEKDKKKKGARKKGKKDSSPPPTNVIDNTDKPRVKEYSLNDVMGI